MSPPTLTQRQVAKIMGLSHQMVQKIEAKALETLRKALERDDIPTLKRVGPRHN